MEIQYYPIEWKEGTMYYAHAQYEKRSVLFYGKISENKRMAIFHTCLNNGSQQAVQTGKEVIDIMNYFIRIAKEQQAEYIDVSKSLASLFKMEQTNMLYELGFSPITQEEREHALFLGEVVNNNGWFRDLSGCFKILRTYRQTIKKECNETFDIYSARITFKVPEKNRFDIALTFKEKTYALQLSRQNEAYTLSFEEKAYVFTSNEELEGQLKQIIDKIQKKNRLALLYNPPREWFDLILKNYDVPQETRDHMHQVLLGELNAEAIETRSKRLGGNTRADGFEMIYWLHFIGYVFILDKKRTYLGHFKKEETEAIKTFSCAVMEAEFQKNMEQKIDTEKKKIEQQFVKNNL